MQFALYNSEQVNPIIQAMEGREGDVIEPKPITAPGPHAGYWAIRLDITTSPVFEDVAELLAAYSSAIDEDPADLWPPVEEE